MNKHLLFSIILFTVILSVSNANAQSGNCLNFDGTDDYVDLPALGITMSEVTVECWIKPESFDDWDAIWTFDAWTTNAVHYQFSNSTLGFSLSGNTPLTQYCTYSFTPNQWYHVAAVYSSTNKTLKYYVNGTLQDSLTYTTAVNIGNAVSNIGSWNADRYFDGQIDEFRIWNGERTGTQIQENMDNELIGNEMGLVAYYQFNHSSGTVLDDITANNNDGTLYNFTLPDAWISTAVSAVNPSGNCLDFDGTDDYVEIADAATLDFTTSMTIETLVRFNDLTDGGPGYDWQCLFAKDSYGGTYALMLLTDDGSPNTLRFYTGTATTDYNWTDVTTDIWYHVAVTFGGSVTKIYIDGQEKGTGTASAITTNDMSLLLGWSTIGGYPLNGKLDEFRIWNISRTQTEILDNMDVLLTGDETGLVAYYRFDQGNAGQDNTSLPNEVIDYASGSAYAGCNKGTLTNFALTGTTSNWLTTGNDKAPILTTTTIANVTGISGDVSGNIFAVGADNVTTRGICYSTGDCPTVADSKVEETGTFGTGIFTKNLTGLSSRTHYYARAYAINDSGISYGETKEFTTDISPNAPDTQAHSITFSNVDIAQMDISWINGDGENRAVFMQQGSIGTANPLDNTTYTANTVFGNGGEIDTSGWYCVYNGTGTSVTVTGLVGGTVYRVMVCEYNQAPGSEVYNINAATDNPNNRKTIAQFEDIGAGLTDVAYSSVAWGDYDNDGDLDILLTGYTGSDRVSKVYCNDGGIFVDINAGLTGVVNSSVAWGDYDNDGDLDILLTGATTSSYPYRTSRIYRNDAGTFVDINAGLTDVKSGSVDWGDYDNDGDLDILLTGYCYDGETYSISKVYCNDGGTFTDINAGLAGVHYSSVAWGDYDNDGDLDILMTGQHGTTFISKVYRNDAGTFVDINAGLTNLRTGSVAWGDYDNDGDLDILLTGRYYDGCQYHYISKVYGNDAGTFLDINAGLWGVEYGSAAWGDYDNDGDLDILLTGWSNSVGYISKLYRNDSGNFTDIGVGLTGVYWGSTAWGDYDNDGDLDILLTGDTGSGYISKVYRNINGTNTFRFNTVPAEPSNLQASVSDNEVTFSWDGATDTQTPSSGLTYNLRVGTTSGSGDMFSPMAQNGGWRKVSELGSQNHNTEWSLNLPDGQYYWSVQAIDGAFAGSPFAADQSFTVNGVLPVEFTAFYAEIVSNGIELHWQTASEMDNVGFYVYRATGEMTSFQKMASPIPGAGTTNEPHDYTFLDTNVTIGTLYRYKLSDITSETGTETFHSEIAVIAGQGMAGSDNLLPTKYALKQNHPNPFNPETIIEFEVPNLNTRHAVSLRVYDSSGKLIKTLLDKFVEPGYHSVIWDGKDNDGKTVNSGVYFYRVATEGYRKTMRCLLLK